ncbi:hypothetical protein [Pediococcus claussenii]|uniref:HTH cro/C1-type domain-containing protein n=1 Tax=Pediococcus claussenii (strain ATCC BAA-344 / DSM 14800 / JCM 18046 / KCTC 3811 / LMG 21948 / P06) TaxID=701521 RepID=G8PD20_PEDCP|nr:hypothetical protein [Pediococcus claussenii]AEV95155.1 hypothetical protein PECL_884 [Pediococcus claussenii ATCC BAA-344]ANZ70389.1 hypothetical protein AYR57_08695 [Pediococcus claussenii]ANZ72205.1 hypothetical protein AYR58_08695 [Pediococcus claussenii]KRN19662.1 hypothetical protein IV79_GL001379 [Pediococcus claussenii]
MKILKKYFEENNLTAYRVGKDNEMPNQTIRKQLENNGLDRLSWKVLKAIANSLNKSVGEVADELIKLENKNTTSK